MTGKRPIPILIVCILIFIRASIVFAQAPVISYTSPQNYMVNTAITPLVPTNAGGAVPANAYGLVSTLAGSGSVGPNNGIGKAASFYNPLGSAIDKFGNLYVCDTYNNLIRKITPGGVVTTFAGSGLQGSANGAGNLASFDKPSGLVIDSFGNLYVADSGNDIIRKITSTGVVSTFAGSGSAGLNDSTGIFASFDEPFALAIDAGDNIYVADTGNNAVRKITSAGAVSTLAGGLGGGYINAQGMAAKFDAPLSVTVNNLGYVYVLDEANECIRVITPSGVVTTFAGNGATALASLLPQGAITMDSSGNLYIVDEDNNQIEKISAAGVLTVIAGSGIRGSADGLGQAASFFAPQYILADNSGNLYISDTGNELIRKLGISGYTINQPLPPGLTFDPTTGTISGTPTAASPATDYTITAYNASGSNSAIVNISVNAIATPVVLPPKISYQTPQTYTTNTAIIPLTPTNTGGAVPATIYGQVSTFAGNPTLGSANGQGTSASFFAPVGIAADAAGNIYVGDEKNLLIRKITPGGLVSTLAGSATRGNTNGNGILATFDHPQGVAVDASGRVYVADEGNNVIREIDVAGNVTNFAGTGAAGSANGAAANATFNHPYSVAVDAAGNVYVGEGASNLVRKITPGSYAVTTLAGSGNAGSANGNGIGASFKNPEGVAVDGAGNVYVADTQNNQIRKITPQGNVTTYAGSGLTGSANGSSNIASFNYPDGVAVDAAGNVYVADQLNNLIRKIDITGMVTALAGNGTVGAADGTGAAATFNQPSYITVDASGNLYVADSFNNEIREIVTTGYTIDKPLPPGLTFNSKTGTITGTPTLASPATVYTITAYNTGGSNSTTLSITVTDEQTVAFAPIPIKTVCGLDFDPGATGSGVVVYTSSNPAVATIVAGKIHITGAGTTVITASDNDSQLTQTLTVDAALTPTISISPGAADNCQGIPVTYNAMITNGGTNPTYQWQVNGNNSGTNSPSFTSSNLTDNDKITCILTSNAICTTSATVTSNIATFTIDPPVITSVSITIAAPGPICKGTPVTFIAMATTSDNNPSYQWQVNGKNAGTNSPVFISSNLADGDVITCLLNSTGKCLVNPVSPSNPITISFSPQSTCLIIIPNAFTPNNDGINDFWDIPALVSYPNCTVGIFNRYGTLVYSSTGYPRGWDGTYNGKPLPAGTYYYVIDPKNSMPKFAGSVMIIR